MSWAYRVPALAGSPWERHQSSRRPADFSEWPTIGLYCPHDTPHDWLLGMFDASQDVAIQSGEIFWGWWREYLTGAGEIIHLTEGHRRATQLLVDDAPAGEKVNALAAESEGHEVRQRIRVRCEVCKLSRVFRSDTLQPILTTLWKFGIREVSLDALARRVDNARAQA